jgi:hypothetical protein
MFTKKYDIAIAGGGVAGCAAALAAARRGARTVLLEKNVYAGGLATAGLVLVYLPLCDGHGQQASFGIAEELFHIANMYGPADEPAWWSSGRFESYFSPASFVLALDKLLTDAGVDLWFDTVITDVEKDAENNVCALQVFNKSGLGRIEADVFIDATGDADVAYMAGNECLCATNSLVTWVVEHRERQQSSVFKFGQNISTLIAAEPIEDVHTESGVNGRMVSEFLLKSRLKYRKMLDSDYGENLETRKTRYPLILPSMAPLRHTRCIKGKTILQPDCEWQSVPDSIGLAADWRRVGKVWEIPYSTLLPDNLKGIIAAGRTTSALDDAWEITRVIPVAAMTGEVAGVAAAMSVDMNVKPDELPYEKLAWELENNCNFILKCNQLEKNETRNKKHSA